MKQNQPSRRQARGDVPFTPEVGADLPARDRAAGNSMYLKRVIFGPPSSAAFDFVDKGNAERELLLTGHLAEEKPLDRGKSAREGHALNLDTLSKLVNPCRIGLSVQAWDDFAMENDAFPKRVLFREWVAEARAKLGAKNNASVAPIMGYTPSSLNKFLGKSPTHRPSSDKLKMLGDFIGRDYRLLIDDPESAPESISKSIWEESSESDRRLTIEILDVLKKIPEKEKHLYIQLIKNGIMIRDARMEAEKKESIPNSKKG